MKSLVCSQLAQIKKMKILLLEFLLAPVVLLIMSCKSSNSLFFESREVVLIALSLIVVFSGEILYTITVDEMKEGIFDIILISPISTGKLILGKVLLPIISSVFIAIVSLFLNNALESYMGTYHVSFSFNILLLLVYISSFSAMLDYGVLLILRRNNKNIHSYMLIVSILMASGLIYFLNKEWYMLFVVLGIAMNVVVCIGITFLLKNKYQMHGSKNIVCSNIFSGKQTGFFSMELKKNVTYLRKNNVLYKLTVSGLLPVVGYLICKWKMLPIEFMLVIAISGIQAMCIGIFVIEIIVDENRSGINELMKVAGKKKIIGMINKSLLASGVSSGFVLFDAVLLFILFRYEYVVYFATIIIMNFIISFICSVVFSGMRKYKYIEHVKGLISLISIALQLGFIKLVGIN